MSLEYCDQHGPYYSDIDVEGCPWCECEAEKALEADRQLDEQRLDDE